VHPVRAFFINGATWGHIAESEVPRPEPPRKPDVGRPRRQPPTMKKPRSVR
jgi:hypothetical protein